jgi:hypothetical protein
MRRVLLSWLVLSVVAVGPVSARDRQPLHVKYVASGNAERTADFKKFLEDEFATVSVTTGRDFDPKTAGPYDVLIIDARVQPALPADFTKPILLLGSNSSAVDAISDNGIWTANMAGSKLDWL